MHHSAPIRQAPITNAAKTIPISAPICSSEPADGVGGSAELQQKRAALEAILTAELRVWSDHWRGSGSDRSLASVGLHPGCQ